MRKRSILQRIGDEVRELRQERNLSQEALAYQSGVHPNVIGKLERGTAESRVLTLFKIATGLHMPLAELIAGVERRR